MLFAVCLERRVPPSFSIKPVAIQEVMLGEDVNLTCVAVGSPMPHVKWIKGTDSESASEDEPPPVGKNIMYLRNVQKSENFTCVAASALGRITAITLVKVKCKMHHHKTLLPCYFFFMFCKTVLCVLQLFHWHQLNLNPLR